MFIAVVQLRCDSFLFYIVLSSPLKIMSPCCLLMVSLHVKEGSNINGKGRRKLP